MPQRTGQCTYPTEEEAEKGLAEVRKAASDKEAEKWLYVERAKQGITPAPVERKADTAVIARYLSDDEAIAIMQYPNGKFYNHYGYDAQSGFSASTAGGFDIFEEAEKALYAHRPKAEKVVELTPAQDNTDLIGTEITIDNRRYVIERIGEISDDVSLRDITFQRNVGFPINRVEKIGYIRRLLEQAQGKVLSEDKTGTPAKPTTEAVAEYPAVENGLPYDIVVEKIRFDEPERKPQGRNLEDILRSRLDIAKDSTGYTALKEDIDTLFMDKNGDSLVGIASDAWLKQLRICPMASSVNMRTIIRKAG